MTSFLNLKIIISVLILALLKDFLFLFAIPYIDPLFETAKYALNVLLNIYFLSFLFLYVTRIKQQKIFLTPFIVMMFVSVYFFIMHLIPDADPDSISQSESMRNTLVTSLLPASLSIIAQVIISFQLIVNTCSGVARNKLKVLGYSYILTMVFTWMLPALNNDSIFAYYSEIIVLIYMLPLLAYLNFYYFESKNTEDSSEIVY